MIKSTFDLNDNKSVIDFLNLMKVTGVQLYVSTTIDIQTNLKKASIRKYRKSEKGQIAIKKYRSSKKGQIAIKKTNKKYSKKRQLNRGIKHR